MGEEVSRAAASKWASGKGYTLHGSVFGGCIHSQVLALQGEEGAPTPAYMQKLFDAGHESERVAKDWLRGQGVRVKDTEARTGQDGTQYQNQIELKTFFNARDASGVMLSLHLDGILQGGASQDTWGLWLGDDAWNGEMALFEHKGLSPEKFDAFVAGGIPGVSQRYAWQCSAAVVLGREHLAKKGTPNPTLPLVFSVERRDYDAATKSYVLSGVRAFQLLREPIYSRADIEARCLSVVHNYLDGIVPECDSEYPCDYSRREQRVAAYPTSSEEAAELHELAHQYHEHQSEIAYRESRMAALRSGLWSIAERNGGLVKAGDYIVDARTDRRGREYFSVKKGEQ